MTLTNQEIIEGLKTNNSSVIKQFYRENFESAYKFIVLNYGDLHDTEDIFQESLYAVFNQIIQDKLNLTCNFTTYFFAIFKNQWYKEIEKRKRIRLNKERIIDLENALFKSLNWKNTTFPEKEATLALIDLEKENIFSFHFNNLKDICKKILLLFFGKTSMKEIATETGYNSENSAKVVKHKCQEKLIENIKKDPAYKNLMTIIRESTIND